MNQDIKNIQTTKTPRIDASNKITTCDSVLTCSIPQRTKTWGQFVKTFGNEDMLKRIIQYIDLEGLKVFRKTCKDANYVFLTMLPIKWIAKLSADVFKVHCNNEKLEFILNNQYPCLLELCSDVKIFYRLLSNQIQEQFQNKQFKSIAQLIEALQIFSVFEEEFEDQMSLLSLVKQNPEIFCNLKTLNINWAPNKYSQKFIDAVPDSIEHLRLCANIYSSNKQILISDLPNVKSITFFNIDKKYYNECTIQRLPLLETIIFKTKETIEINFEDCPNPISIEYKVEETILPRLLLKPAPIIVKKNEDKTNHTFLYEYLPSILQDSPATIAGILLFLAIFLYCVRMII